MRKRDLAQAVAAHTDVDPRVAATVIDVTLEVILATVASGEDVALTGFAKFSKVKRPARMARNPATGESVRVKAKTVAKITPLKGFKDVVLGVAPAPKLTKPKTTIAKKAAAAATPRKTTGVTPKTTTRSATAARKASSLAPARRATRSG
jgi:DNA-binding protein HU-beta